jgi:ABC-type branched-chain amino acid transport systems, periplasmic component
MAKKMKSGWKHHSLVFLLIFVLLLLSACGSQGSNQPADGATTVSEAAGKGAAGAEATGTGNKTLKIGALVSLSGPFAPLGESVKNAVELYADQHGNMLGDYKLELKFEDDENNPQVALRKYRQLVDNEKINLLIGPVSTTVVYAILNEIEKDKIIMLPNAGANDISWSKKSDYIYRVSMASWQLATAGADYFAEHLGKKVYTIAPDYAAGKEMLDAFTAAFTAAGGEIVGQAWPKVGTNDFGSYLSQIATSDIDFVYGFIPGTDGTRFIQQYSQFGLKDKIPLAGAFSFNDPVIIDPAGDAAEGIVSVLHYSYVLDNPINNEFVKAYEEKYSKVPDYFASYGYDAVLAIGKAVQEAGDIGAESLVKAFDGLEFEGTRGTMTIDANTNNLIQKFYISKNVKKDGRIAPEILQDLGVFQMPENEPGN